MAFSYRDRFWSRCETRNFLETRVPARNSEARPDFESNFAKLWSRAIARGGHCRFSSLLEGVMRTARASPRSTDIAHGTHSSPTQPQMCRIVSSCTFPRLPLHATSCARLSPHRSSTRRTDGRHSLEESAGFSPHPPSLSGTASISSHLVSSHHLHLIQYSVPSLVPVHLHPIWCSGSVFGQLGVIAASPTAYAIGTG